MVQRVAILIAHALGTGFAVVILGLGLLSIDLVWRVIRSPEPGVSAWEISLSVLYGVCMLYVGQRLLRQSRDSYRARTRRCEAARAPAPSPLPHARIVPR